MDEPLKDIPRARRWRWALAALVLAVLAAGLWLDTRGRIAVHQEAIERRLAALEAEGREARAQARQAGEALREALARLVALEARLADSQSQQAALAALYDELARKRDEWQLAEIEQVLAIAQQQLQLSGNVRAALLALQLAEHRLQRADRAQFLPLKRALARDIERLKSASAPDIPGMSLALASLVAAVDTLPLAYEERTGRSAGEAPAAARPEDGFFTRLGMELWRELRQLVIVRRADAPEPPLVPPPQAWFLRENLKLRLLNARLALLVRDEAGYRDDLRVAQAWIRRYFDARAKPAQAALAQLRPLASATLSLEPPSIAESLEAVRGFKTRR